MENLKARIKTVSTEFSSALAKVATEKELEEVRINFLGRSGQIAQLMSALKTLSVEEKRELGPLLNELKKNSEQQFNEKKEALGQEILQAATTKKQYFDVTASHYSPLRSSLHVYTHIIEQLQNIFISMGYYVADGPEVETDYYNFEALNIPADHPARDMHDTFWLNIPNMLMRTHTSPVQIHSMETQSPPLAIFAPGRCYRNEATDASHDFMFMQGEGLVVDKDISMGHLLATAKTFLQALFEKKDLEIRVRPGFFPFVEPGVEIDASCPFCKNGCSICKKTRWIELLGAGLVHPNVLEYGGIDPEIYSGFAFGFGLERLAMIKYGINDIRLFRGNKSHFLDQF